MAHPYHHALSSVRKWGGSVEDYLTIHTWFDGSKEITADFRHRALRHHAEGIFMAEKQFGTTITLREPDRALYLPCYRQDRAARSAGLILGSPLRLVCGSLSDAWTRQRLFSGHPVWCFGLATHRTQTGTRDGRRAWQHGNDNGTGDVFCLAPSPSCSRLVIVSLLSFFSSPHPVASCMA